MILEEAVKKIVEKGSDNPLYTRNLIKEEIQNYILNFIYNDPDYNDLIFTGGTCLRKVYGLNRLSEDLDFDYLDRLTIDDFAGKVESYFRSSVKYKKIRSSVSGNENSVYFKFPILKELDLYSDRVPEDIFVRCDFFGEEKGGYGLDKNMITAGSFQFFVNSYDLPTMFANKIAAFLERSFFQGKFQEVPFKGRDVYDLYWLMQLSAKSSYEVSVNSKRLKLLLEKEIGEIKNEFCKKMEAVNDKFLYNDLYPLIGSKKVLDEFMGAYKSYLPKYIDMVL